MLTSEKPLCFFVQLGGYQTHIHRRLCRNPQRVISGASVPEENRRWTLGAGDEVTGEGTYTSNIEVPQEALVVRS